MQVEQVQDAADCTDILNPLADIDSLVLNAMNMKGHIVVEWDECELLR